MSATETTMRDHLADAGKVMSDLELDPSMTPARIAEICEDWKNTHIESQAARWGYYFMGLARFAPVPIGRRFPLSGSHCVEQGVSASMKAITAAHEVKP